MIIDAKSGKLAFFQDLYEDAKGKNEADLAKMDAFMRQYQGSPEMDGGVDATVVRNITYELIESQVTSYIPTPKVDPEKVSANRIRKAKAIETLLKNIRNKLPFERMNDMDERYSPVYGGSVWFVEWDESEKTHNTLGEVKVSCIAPHHFVGQPGIVNINDMEYCFIDFDTTKEDIVRKYGVSMDKADEAGKDEQDDDDAATLHVCYYKNDDDKVCQYIWSADVELLDVEDYYARKRKICAKCGKAEGLCECEKPKFEMQNDEYEEVKETIYLSDGTTIEPMSVVVKDGRIVTETVNEPVILNNGNPVFGMDENGGTTPMTVPVEVPKMEKTKLPYYMPTRFPVVIRKNVSAEDSVFGQSDCEVIRPQQQAVNKIESRIMEKLIGGGVYPIVPEEFKEGLDNSIFKRVFRAKASNAKTFGTMDLQANIQQDIAEAERQYDQAKRILGITNSFQGQYDASAQSGKAKQIQVSQAQGRLDSKRQMKNAAYADIDRIIFQYYLAYADEPRPAVYQDENGEWQEVEFNRYDFLERDSAGEYYYDDRYLFSADASVPLESQREMMWQQEAADFSSGAYGQPQDPNTLLLFWQMREKSHFPGAHDMVERLKKQRDDQIMQMQETIRLQNLELEARKGYENELLGGMNNGNGNA